jgi:creatinine amidohydrolase
MNDKTGAGHETEERIRARERELDKDVEARDGGEKRRNAVMKLLLVLAPLLLSITLPNAAAQSPTSLSLEQLTWTELRDEIKAGKTTILVPIGGTEQNGPHMALGKHNVRAKVLAERIAQRLGNALVAPVIAYVPEGSISPPTAHMRYPGTITIPEDAFEKTLEWAARSFRQHGFKDVVFLGDHGGYLKSVKKVVDKLNREWRHATDPGRAAAHAIEEYYRAADTEFARMLKAEGYSADEIGTHAGLADTALTLDIDSRLVRTDRLEAAAKSKDQGVNGDPRRATKELGERGNRVIVENTTEAIIKSIARR